MIKKSFSLKSLKLLLVILFTSGVNIILAQNFKVLVFHKTTEFRHTEAIPESITMLRELGNTSEFDKWTIDETIDASVFTDANLAQYEVIVFSNTTGGQLLNTDQQAAMERFIQSGKGFVGFHSATDTYRNDKPGSKWLWYNELVGGIVQINPYHTANNLPGTMNVLNDHPIVSHIGSIGATWEHSEEWYYWERNGGQLSNDNTVLLEVQSTGNESYDAKRPVTWLKEYDGGRSFYTALGQNGRTYKSNTRFREMAKKAILWAANKLPNVDNCSTLTSTWKDLLSDDLNCWEKWIGVPHSTTGLPGSSSNVTNGSGTPLGLNNDPRDIFTIRNVAGEKQLYITGEVYGGLTTKSEYGNYHLSMQFKWGQQKWEPRLNQKRDSGILYHCKGEHGKFWGVWKSSLEFQVQEGDCGDFIALADVGAKIPSVNGLFNPSESPKSVRFVKRSQNFENPNGQWNTLEVIVVGDRAIHYVNGNMVNALIDSKWKGNKIYKGQIQIQSEAAEIYYRDIKIKAVTDFPEADKVTLGWTDTVAGPTPTPTCGNTAPIGDTIALKKSGGDKKWVTINGSTTDLIANGTEANRALFKVESHPNGCIALKSVSTGKYIQVNGQNTDVVLKAKGNAPGTWENFEWKQKGNTQVALKSLFNQGWVQASWTQNNTALFPKGDADGTWETFDYVTVSAIPDPDPNPIDTMNCTPNASITGLSINRSGTNATLSFTNLPSGVGQYEVRSFVKGTYTAGISGTAPFIWSSGQSSPITIKNLTAGTEYTVVLRATCPNGGGSTKVSTINTDEGSNPGTVVDTPCSANATISGLNVTRSGTEATLTFNNLSGVKAYEVRTFVQGTYTSGISGTAPFIWSSGSSSPVTIKNLNPSTQYTIVIRAICNAGGPTNVFTVGTASAKSLNLNTKLDVSAYGNPTKLSISYPETRTASVKLYSITGNLISSENVDLNAGKTVVKLPSLASGPYLASVSVNGITKTIIIPIQ